MPANEEFYIPQYLDEPERWLFWTLDEAMILVTPIVISLLASHIFLGIIISCSGYIFWVKLKRNGHISTIIFAIYWFYPAKIIKLVNTPPSHIRFYI